jgi:ribosomal protein S18 acetylase RimI-like enzyme
MVLDKLYPKGSLSFDYIKKTLLDNDDRFHPKLSLEVDLEEYARKLQKNAHTLLLEDAESLVGFVFFYIFEPDQEVVYISLICSLRKGNGKRLYHDFLKSLPTKIKEVQLEVSCDNLNAINFYKKLGFQKLKKVHQKNKLLLKKNIG